MGPILTFSSLRQLLADRHPPEFAFYPSCGLDRKPFRFLHPEFLRLRFSQAATDIPQLAGFIYVDRRGPWLRSGKARLVEDSGQLRLSTLRQTAVEVAGLRGDLLEVEATSPGQSCWRPWVLAVPEENHRVAEILNREQIRPDLLIGVSDGCRLGGNARCVLDAAQPLLDQSPRWCVADHFSPELVTRSRTPGRELGLLSSEWGNYQGNSDRLLAGATLFKIS